MVTFIQFVTILTWVSCVEYSTSFTVTDISQYIVLHKSEYIIITSLAGIPKVRIYTGVGIP